MDPHPVIVTIGDNRDYIKVLFYSLYTTITGWGVLLRHRVGSHKCGRLTQLLPLDATSWVDLYPVQLLGRNC